MNKLICFFFIEKFNLGIAYIKYFCYNQLNVEEKMQM